jgi:hypothetical protein
MDGDMKNGKIFPKQLYKVAFVQYCVAIEQM